MNERSTNIEELNCFCGRMHMHCTKCERYVSASFELEGSIDGGVCERNDDSSQGG